MAANTRPVGGAGQRGHAATNADRARHSEMDRVPGVVPDTRIVRSRPSWATCCGCGRGSGTRAAHATCRQPPSQIVRRGAFPETLEDLLSLPGVGAYTARAVLAFAFEADAAVVDTNIARVYARVAGARLTGRQVQAAADAALPVGDSWRWNQCLMDLGATLCRPTPQCDRCPLRTACAWRRAGGDLAVDPSVGSAGVSRPQRRFEGSERQARGRLLRALSSGSVSVGEAALVMNHPSAPRLVAALCSEGLVRQEHETLRLP